MNFKAIMASLSDKLQQVASQTLRKTLQTVPLGVSRSISSGTLPIFIFHAVESSPKPYIRHLYDCHSPQSFERVLDEISFTAPDRGGETVTIDGAYVRKGVADLAKNADLSRFIL